jgi:signal transduction histidine kinase
MVEADLDPSVEADPALVRAALTAAGVALENGRLTVERAAHLAEISASRTRIVESGLAQRRALERDLHDGAQQYLLAASATLTRVEHAEGPEAVASAIADARGQLSTAMAELRRLARGVHPAALSQNGLAAGLASLADLAGDVELTLHGPVARGERLDPAVESTAYFLVAEAVANARKHAPGARVSVTVTEKPDELAIRVDDDGPGGATMQPGGGLSGLADRVRALGGRLEIRSTAGGSTVAATFPCGRRDR